MPAAQDNKYSSQASNFLWNAVDGIDKVVKMLLLEFYKIIISIMLIVIVTSKLIVIVVLVAI